MSEQKRKFKIMIYGEFFLPVVGGVQTAMNLLAKGLMALNSSPEKDAGLGEIEVTVVTRSAASGMDDSAFPYRVVRRPGLWELVKLIRESDVVHVAGPCLAPMAIGWLIRKPTVVEHHGYQAICPNGLLFREPSKTVCSGYFSQGRYGKCVQCASQTMGFLGAIRTLLLTFPRRWLCRRVSANITITNHVAARLQFPRMQTVYYGIEEPSPVPRGEPQSSPKVFEVAYVGRLVPEKGLPILLQAAELLKNDGVSFKLTFIGDGPERKSLEELASRLGISDFVRFTGDLRGPDLDGAVENVTIMAMPSVWEETAGLSAIEQMMRGRVVAVADIGGLSEVVGDVGLKFPPGDAESLAECIRDVSYSPTVLASLGRRSRERALELFKLRSMIDGHVSLYREVLLGRMHEHDAGSMERRTEV